MRAAPTPPGVGPTSARQRTPCARGAQLPPATGAVGAVRVSGGCTRWCTLGGSLTPPRVGPTGITPPRQPGACTARKSQSGTGGTGVLGLCHGRTPATTHAAETSLCGVRRVGHRWSTNTRTQASASEAGVTDSDSGTADSDSGTADSDSGGAEATAAAVSPERLWALAERVRARAPLVQSITNFVVMNNSANALLAVGASPIMAHGMPEMDEMVSLCQALVVNIGTLDEYFVEAMFMGANQACALGKPWVLDPVGAGATAYRDDALQVLLEKKPTIIRGNASEILALARASAPPGAPPSSAGPTKGVDSTAASTDAIQAGRDLGEKFGCVVSISGATDVVLQGSKALHFSNGHPMMTRVTGLGCSLSAVTGAFAAVTEDYFEAAAAATAYFGVAGQLAAQGVPGPGSLQLALLDKLYNLTREEFMTHLQMSQA